MSSGKNAGKPPVRRTSWWRPTARILATALLIASITFLLLQVYVADADGSSRSCGSSFDVIAGRADWQHWRSADLADRTSGRLVRTENCPSAVNQRTALAGGLALAGAVLLVAAVGRPSRGTKVGLVKSQKRLLWLGNAATTMGALLSLGGLIGLVILLANPRSTLFLYASRTAVLLIGLAVLQPGLALLVVGLTVSTLARSRSQGSGE